MTQKNPPLGLVFNEDVAVDTLLAESSISLSKIKADRVSLSSGSQSDQLGIHMHSDRIMMQAQEFYVGSKRLYDVEFEIPNELKIVEAENGLTEISTIKSIKDSTTGEYLSVISKGSLNLSGNRGLTVSGKRFNIYSKDKITMKSRWENLSLFAMKGVCLPNLIAETELSGNSNIRSNICIEKSSGLIDLCSIDK